MPVLFFLFFLEYILKSLNIYFGTINFPAYYNFFTAYSQGDLLQAITEVGEVIQFYDSDKRYSAWGFGGRTMDGSVSHCFNLNGSPYHTEVI